VPPVRKKNALNRNQSYSKQTKSIYFCLFHSDGALICCALASVEVVSPDILEVLTEVSAAGIDIMQHIVTYRVQSAPSSHFNFTSCSGDLQKYKL
jgi:hypothetical protein